MGDEVKIVITGASGFVGRQLVPLLRARGADLLLAGRDPQVLERQFPDLPSCDYASLPTRAAGYDLLVNLATRNNDQAADLDEFRQVNVTHLISTYQAAAAAGIPRFVDISSLHALDEGNRSPYAVSKREGTQAIAAQPGPRIQTVYLAAVYGEDWSGRLAILNRLPRFLAKQVFLALAALKPTVNVAKLADHLMDRDEADQVLLTDGQAGNWVYRFVTRALNLVAGVGILLGLSWLLLGLWVAIRLNSPGPGLFAQARLGRNGQVFTCYKFRTMAVGTRQLGTHEVSASVITSLGRVLRATKLDELPQAWNLLRNNMSLIGPRPGLPVQEALTAARQARGVFDLTPGISGLAQVNGVDMSDPLKLSIWDARYGALQCLTLDLKLMLATVRGGGQGDPAQGSLAKN